jgi:hypothetical protein
MNSAGRDEPSTSGSGAGYGGSVERMRVELRPITDSDVPRVARFLHSCMDPDVSVEQWTHLIDVTWSFERPNSGFMLVDGPAVVGAYLAFYSERSVDGRSERFCDLGSWCVQPTYRLHSLSLLKALLAQDGYHFIDLTPDRKVIALNERLGFRRLEGRTALLPNLPWPSLPRRSLISSDPAVIERTLEGADLRVYRDHADADRVRQVVLRSGEESCHVVFRRDRRMGLPRALLLHVSNPKLYRKLARPLGSHLLLRHGAALQQVEHSIVARPPRLSVRVRPAHRMIRSARAEPPRIDYLYSELARLSW